MVEANGSAVQMLEQIEDGCLRQLVQNFYTITLKALQ